MMSNRVKIVADSTCDLNQEVLAGYGIETIALPVNLGDKACLDGIDVHTPDLFQYYKETGKLPTTSAPIMRSSTSAGQKRGMMSST